MPTPEELIGELQTQENALYDACGGSERSLDTVHAELVEAEEAFTQATEDEDAEAVAEATQKCEEFAGEIATLINRLQVDVDNMAVNLKEIEEAVLEGYTVSDA